MTDFVPKIPKTYICKYCNYNTSNKKDYNKHLLTAKHKRLTEADGIYPKEQIHHSCSCGKIYKQRQSLFKHRKACNYDLNQQGQGYNPVMLDERHASEGDPVDKIDNASHITSNANSSNIFTTFQQQSTLILELVKENKEFKELLIEQNKQIIELSKNTGNTITNNNTTNNNKFNLNFFLNETCKDAITMNEFINSIEVSMEDFIRTGNIGFVDGISKVMVERIKDMELHTRPMHCTDLKRETVYIKDDSKWEKDDINKSSLRKAVKNVANKNYKLLQKWYDNSKPNVEQIGTEDCENYFKYYKASLGGYDKEEDKKFEEKIIKNVLKKVVLEKNT